MDLKNAGLVLMRPHVASGSRFDGSVKVVLFVVLTLLRTRKMRGFHTYIVVQHLMGKNEVVSKPSFFLETLILSFG